MEPADNFNAGTQSEIHSMPAEKDVSGGFAQLLSESAVHVGLKPGARPGGSPRPMLWIAFLALATAFEQRLTWVPNNLTGEDAL